MVKPWRQNHPHSQSIFSCQALYESCDHPVVPQADSGTSGFSHWECKWLFSSSVGPRMLVFSIWHTVCTNLYLFRRGMIIKQLCMLYLFVLYRFGGAEFPPIIMFKIFIHSGGQGVKYYCGKKVIKPASEVIKNVIKTYSLTVVPG